LFYYVDQRLAASCRDWRKEKPP